MPGESLKGTDKASDQMEVIRLSSYNTTMKTDRVESIDMADLSISDRDDTGQGTRPAHRPLVTPLSSDHRPFDIVTSHGPPADPIQFPDPVIKRGRRHEVVCYIPTSNKHEVLNNVLFRDYTREYDKSSKEGKSPIQAYYPIPYKKPIKTIMGHVEICLLLRQSLGSSSEDEDDGSYDEDDEDVVFELTDTYVAVKVNYYDRMQSLKNKHAEDPMKEIAAMQLIGSDHPNVLGCMEVLFDGKNVNVVMPYCDKGDLFELLQGSQNSETPGMSEAQARFWFRQVVDGVKHLHSVGVCHRDLSPENVMIDKNNRAMIIDMGMCLRVPYTDGKNPQNVTDVQHGSQRRLFKPQGACGKLPYMSPEIYRNRDAFDGSSSDVWTAGTILFCMVTGNRSYQRPHKSDAQFYWMTQGLDQLLNDWQVDLSEEGKHLLKNMLQVDPRLRLSLDEVLNHPWFAHADDNSSVTN